MHGSAYIFDPRSQMFYDAKSDFFHDPNSKLYYSNKKQAYFRLVEGMENPTFEKVAGSSDLQSNAQQANSTITDGKKSIKIHIRSKSLSKSRARSQSRAKETPSNAQQLDKKKREQLVNAEKWNQLSLKSSLIHSQSAAAPSILPRTIASSSNSESVIQSVFAVAQVTSGELPVATASESVANKNHALVATTSGGNPICLVCKRKFGSLEQLRRHEELSDLHKANLAKIAATKVPVAQPIEEPPIKYQDRAKRRRMLHADAPTSLPRKPSLHPGTILPRNVPVDPEVALGNQNVGNQLFQKMMSKAKPTTDNGKNSDICESIKQDWKRIESLTNSRSAAAQDIASSKKGLGIQ